MNKIQNQFDLLPIMEQFYSIQGEGFFQGHAAVFIRLGGCDVGCVWCDVKDSWDADAHKKFSVEEIVAATNQSPSDLVVITGGEPLMHNLETLTSQLKSAGKKTNLETSGTHPLSGQWDWICFSPKKFKEPISEIYNVANELKVVVFNQSDFEFAVKHAQLVSTNCKLYLQPEWSNAEKMTPLVIDFVKRNPQWEISLQIHKYMNIE
ncbi:MAG: 7-carboxy-7-deazaguanine synthase QueE [Sphingobacteriales bacterium]|nr:MAG: 7-carboxy-7-deazaguanine synthase QueE [Sphingobacteriales bacterium]